MSRGAPVLKTRAKVRRNEAVDYIVAPSRVVCRKRCKKSHEEEGVGGKWLVGWYRPVPILPCTPRTSQPKGESKGEEQR